MTTAALALLLALRAAAPAETAPLDLEKFQGRWFEIARFDTFFQKGCVGTTSTYSKGDAPGELKVINRCFEDRLDGEPKRIEGTLWTPDPKSPGKLKIRFVWPFSSDFWVLDVAPDYTWALVGDPKKERCWIFQRSPQMDEALYQQLVGKLKARGFDTSKLIRVAQPKEG